MDVATSLPFYHNRDTGESRWEQPEGLKDKDMTGISSSPTLQSKPSMYKLTNSAEMDQLSCWAALRERSYVTNNNSIAGSSPTMWVAYWDPESNRHFYYNSRTDVSSWDIPQEWIAVINKRHSESMLNVKADASSMRGQGRVTYVNQDLSDTEGASESGSRGHSNTGAKAMSEDEDGGGDSSGSGSSSSPSRLKIMRVTSFLHQRHSDWECYLDEHHRMFYVNKSTQESTWEPPKDFGNLVATSAGIVEEDCSDDDESIQNVEAEDLFM